MQNYKLGLVWLRRDYRIIDNTALNNAIKTCDKVIVCFIYDANILNKLDNDDQRIPFIMDSVREVDNELNKLNSGLIVRYGCPQQKIPEIINKYNVAALFFNRDYEPYAKTRDQQIKESVKIPVHTFKDSVIHEKDEIKTKSDGYYTVFTPYKNNWLTAVKPISNTISFSGDNFLSLNEDSSIQDDRWYDLLKFTRKKSFCFGGRSHALKKLEHFSRIIHDYDAARDFPALNQTSGLSPYLRFGCISVRECVEYANKYQSTGASIWLSEIVWRDFYQMVCDTHPTCDKQAIKPIYDTIEWQGKDDWFDAWCNGQTGFPIVDAAMRQLNQTGLMHNRCRMITASFLCKTLLIDWRKGEQYFAKKLLDFDFASNNGGWQWSSSSGCDAQPYFRIFNPYAQSEKFDANAEYIRHFCPELSHLSNKEIHNPPITSNYPAAIVDYKTMRQKALDMYSVVKK